MSVFEKRIKLFENDYFYIIEDKYPVTPGHVLVVSKRKEVKHFFQLSIEEMKALPLTLHIARGVIQGNLGYHPDGYNIGMNVDSAGGQTVMHFHCHVIPRYKGDMKDPRGGVRNCIPSKGNYLL